MGRTCLLVLTFAAATTCGVLALQQPAAHAQKKDTAATPELGKNWRSLRDGLDTVFEELQKLNGLKASGQCDDETYLRRVYLDLLGVPPTPAEIAAFAPGRKDAKGRKGQEKREALIEEVLKRPEYAENFAEHWRVQAIGRDKGREYTQYLEQYFRQAFAENRPWDRVIRELVSAKGNTPENPGIAYLATFENERADIAGTTMRVFLGKQIQCAQCHDHPYEEWKTDDFVALQGFFGWSASGARGDGADRYWFVNDNPMPANGHELSARLRLRGRYNMPKYLGGDLYKFDKEKSLRQSLGEWMTSPENKWFREATVNRMFAYFLGAGFVNPVDDFSSVNEPSVPVVLDMMGKDFAASGFDLHYLIKAITTSKLYQRSAQPTRYNRKDRMYYSRFFVRKQSPEQMFRSVLKVTGIEELNKYLPVREVPDDKLSTDEKANKAVRDRVMGYRNTLAMYFRGAYGSDEPEKAFDDYSGSIMQALLLMNFPLLGDGSLKTNFSEIMARSKDGRVRIELIYQTVLGRNPTAREWALLRGTMATWPDNDTAYEDLFMALMNTTEFSTVG